MFNTFLQVNQLHAEAGQAQAAKKGAVVNLADLLFAQNTGTASATPLDAFEGLLASLANGGKIGKAADASTLLGTTPSATTTATTTTAAKSGDLTLEDLLKGLPPEIASLLRAQAAAATQAGTMGQGQDILDALSTNTPAASGKTPELFAIIDDPKLASALAGLSAQINALKANAALMTPVQGNMQQNVLSPALLQAAAEVKNAIAGLQNNTITIATLDGDQFQTLKKIAFADIAPFLTQPRTVVIGDRIAKIAQGPSFLDDGSKTDVTIMSISGSALAAVINAQQTHTPLQVGTSTDITTILQNIAAAETATAGTPQSPAMAAIAAAAAPVLGATSGKSSSTSANAGTDTFSAGGQAAADAALLAGGTQLNAQIMGSRTGTAQKIIAAAILSAAGANTEGVHDSKSRGFGDILTDVASSAATASSVENPFAVHADSDINGILKAQMDQSQSALGVNASSTLMSARSAGAPHPAMHLVSVALQRNLNPRTAGTDKEFTISMEPGSLGRVKITLQFGEDNTVKAKLMAENPATLSMLQKDVGALDKVLSNSGFDTSHVDTFSFNLAQGDSFSQAMHQDTSSQNQGHGNSSGNAAFGTDPAVIENVMPIFVDPATGLTHVNITV